MNLEDLQREIAIWKEEQQRNLFKYKDERGEFWTNMAMNNPERYKKEIQGHEGVCCPTHGCKLGFGATCPVYWNGSIAGQCEPCLKTWGKYIKQ